MRRALKTIRGIGFPTNAVLLGDGDVIAIDGKALQGARDKGQSAGQSAGQCAGQGARTRMMVSAYAARLRLTLATVAADHGGELEAANLRRRSKCSA